MVLLDDPLSAVDRHVSKLIWKSCIQKLLKDKTVLIATHQLNYIKDADFIYNFENGKILECGTPEDLLNSDSDIGGRYERFVSTANKKDESQNLPRNHQKLSNCDHMETNGDVQNDEFEETGSEKDALISKPEVEKSHDLEIRPAANWNTYYQTVKNGPGFSVFVLLALLYLITIGCVQGNNSIFYDRIT